MPMQVADETNPEMSLTIPVSLQVPTPQPWTYAECVTSLAAPLRNLAASNVEEAPVDVSNDEDDDPLCPTIQLTKEEVEAIRAPWRKALIIKVMGRKVGYTYLLKRLQTMWMPRGILELIAIDNDYYLVRFGSVDDLEFAIFEGPWMVLDHYLIVKPWMPDFDPTSDTTEKVLVWVRIPCISAEYYNIIFLRKLGNKIGRMLRVDQATSLVSRGHFARICVEVDMTKPLISKFKYKDKVRSVAYEGIHLVCFTCGIYGHAPDAYPKITKAPAKQAGVVETRPDQVSEAPFGAWMIAPGRRSRAGLKQLERIQNGAEEGRHGGNANREDAGQGDEEDTNKEAVVETDTRLSSGARRLGNNGGQTRKAQATAAQGGKVKRPNVIAIEKQIINEPDEGGGQQTRLGELSPNSRRANVPYNSRSTCEEDQVQKTGDCTV
ncbi:PREDICTED: uncharacterized protein LOC109168452 [Ipomoea nil]|uniref:uncharacterized protein LOC109168452 n=1 Tax=Ipomoea nil TaxID=35883 RepID=UPI0009008679|nr:PREDICTED: uncharacterized protein LOC109168452 [Ipomoea nil]